MNLSFLMLLDTVYFFISDNVSRKDKKSLASWFLFSPVAAEKRNSLADSGSTANLLKRPFTVCKSFHQQAKWRRYCRKISGQRLDFPAGHSCHKGWQRFHSLAPCRPIRGFHSDSRGPLSVTLFAPRPATGPCKTTGVKNYRLIGFINSFS